MIHLNPEHYQIGMSDGEIIRRQHNKSRTAFYTLNHLHPSRLPHDLDQLPKNIQLSSPQSDNILHATWSAISPPSLISLAYAEPHTQPTFPHQGTHIHPVLTTFHHASPLYIHLNKNQNRIANKIAKHLAHQHRHLPYTTYSAPSSLPTKATGQSISESKTDLFAGY